MQFSTRDEGQRYVKIASKDLSQRRYRLNSISGVNKETTSHILAQPYGALLLALNAALCKSKQTLLGLLIAPKPQRFIRVIPLDENGSYASLWGNIKRGGKNRFECTATVPLTSL